MRTNKQGHAAQIARHVFIADRLRNALPQAVPKTPPPSESRNRIRRREPNGNPVEKFSLANSERDYEDITAWVSSHRDDPAFKV